MIIDKVFYALKRSCKTKYRFTTKRTRLQKVTFFENTLSRIRYKYYDKLVKKAIRLSDNIHTEEAQYIISRFIEQTQEDRLFSNNRGKNFANMQHNILLNSFKNKEYEVNEPQIMRNGTEVALVLRERQFHDEFIDKENINTSTFLSYTPNPDDAIIVKSTKKITIFEYKYRESVGSSDMLFVCAEFYRQQYRKMVKSIGYKVEFIVLLHDYYKKNIKYKDMISYLQSRGIKVLFKHENDPNIYLS